MAEFFSFIASFTRDNDLPQEAFSEYVFQTLNSDSHLLNAPEWNNGICIDTQHMHHVIIPSLFWYLNKSSDDNPVSARLTLRSTYSYYTF